MEVDACRWTLEWKYMEVDGSRWKCLKVDGSSWKSMDIDGS